MTTIQEELAALEKVLKEYPTSLHINQAKNLRRWPLHQRMKLPLTRSYPAI